MKVLVTGATGFVGRHLLPALEHAGHSLTLPIRDSGAEARLPEAIAPTRRRISVLGDIDESAEDKEAFMRVNARGTSRLVQQSVDAGVQ